MAAVRGRRPGRKIPGWQMPRMFLPWVVLVSLALALGESSQMNVTYNMEKRTLRIVCPLEKSNTLVASYLKRRKNNSATETMIGHWRYKNGLTSKHERAQVQNTNEERLVVELSHVTCFDSALYICINTVDVNRRYNYSFTYMGEATKPYLSVPVQRCYNPGDQLQLNCSASVGAKDNNIVWTVRKAGATTASAPLNTTGRDEETVEPDCTLRRTSQLNYTLTQEDDGAIFECRLNSSGHSSRIIVTACSRCPDVNTAISAVTKSEIMPYSEAPLGSKELDKQPDSPKYEEVRGENDGGAQASDSPSAGTVVIIILAALLAVCAVVMFLLMRRWRKRQMRPLVVVDTPAASEFGYTDGRLPHLLHTLNMLDRHPAYPAHDLTRSTFTLPNSSMPTTTSRYVESPHSSSSCHYQEDPNVSVYVTMSGLDSLQRPTTEAKQLKNPGQGRDPEPRSMADNPASMLSEYDNDMGPDMREERSESIYSNQERNIRQGSGNNGKADADAEEITRLKIVP